MILISPFALVLILACMFRPVRIVLGWLVILMLCVAVYAYGHST